MHSFQIDKIITVEAVHLNINHQQKSQVQTTKKTTSDPAKIDNTETLTMQQELIYRESTVDESGNESIFVVIMFRIEPEEENPINSNHYQNDYFNSNFNKSSIDQMLEIIFISHLVNIKKQKRTTTNVYRNTTPTTPSYREKIFKIYRYLSIFNIKRRLFN